MKTITKVKHPVRNTKIEIWGKSKVKNELKQTEFKDVILETVWAKVIPQTGRLINAPANTNWANITHKIEIRYASFPNLTRDMWFMYKGKRFDIDFILNPYERNEFLESFTKQVN